MPHVREAFVPALLLAAAFGTAPAQAQIMVYTTFESWAAAVTGIGRDGFDDLDTGAGFLDAPLLRNAGSFGYAIRAPEGLYPGGTVANPWVGNYFVEEFLTFDSFSPGATALGGEFFLTNVNGQLGVQGNLTVRVQSGAFDLTETLQGATTPRFLGFTGLDAFTSVQVSAVGAVPIANPIFATADNFQLATAAVTPVPEPSSVALMLAGLGVVAWVARRRDAAVPRLAGA